MRKDLITNTMMPKKELVRIVVDKEKNIFVDPTGKKSWAWCICFIRT